MKYFFLLFQTNFSYLFVKSPCTFQCVVLIQFTPTAQGELTVRITIKYLKCCKPRLMYTRKNLAKGNTMPMKRIFSKF